MWTFFSLEEEKRGEWDLCWKQIKPIGNHSFEVGRKENHWRFPFLDNDNRGLVDTWTDLISTALIQHLLCVCKHVCEQTIDLFGPLRALSLSWLIRRSSPAELVLALCMHVSLRGLFVDMYVTAHV